MNSNILVVGSINMDLLIKIPRVPMAGENIFGRDFQTIPGGKGANSKFSRESAFKLGETIRTVDLVLLQLELPLDVVDTTAAGDAFSAALSVGIVEGKSLEEAVAFANAAGALAVTKLGARPSIPTLAELETFLSKS